MAAMFQTTFWREFTWNEKIHVPIQIPLIFFFQKSSFDNKSEMIQVTNLNQWLSARLQWLHC